jgi:hypothetical protein
VKHERRRSSKHAEIDARRQAQIVSALAYVILTQMSDGRRHRRVAVSLARQHLADIQSELIERGLRWP